MFGVGGGMIASGDMYVLATFGSTGCSSIPLDGVVGKVGECSPLGDVYVKVTNPNPIAVASSVTPTQTGTSSATPTRTGTPSVTPTNTGTPSVT